MQARSELLGELTGLIESELARVGELRDALARQRGGIVDDDRAAIQESVDAIGRVVLALDGVRRRRARVIGTLTGDEHCPLADLEARIGAPLPERFGRARAELRVAAQSASTDLSINHAVLRAAVEAGEALLERLFAPGRAA